MTYFVLAIPATKNGNTVPAVKGTTSVYDDALALYFTECASMAKAGRPSDGVLLMDGMGNTLKVETHVNIAE